MSKILFVAALVAACGGSKPAHEETTPPPAAPVESKAPVPPPNPAAEQDAVKLNDEGKQAMFSNNYEDGATKFRAAIALDPKPLYAFNLCVADYSLGKFAEAKTACKTAAASPDAALAGKANKMLSKIDDEAKKQGIALP